MYYKPIDIAKSLNITTSALRHYEAWGIVPIPERALNGYRLYTEKHVAYFRCIRAMYPGFDMGITKKIMKHIQRGEVDEAFWIVNKEQADLQQEKVLTDQTLTLLQNPNLIDINEKQTKKEMTIGGVAKLADVPPSAIRHWEKEGLITPTRNPENGYRTFNRVHLRQILVIRALRNLIHYLENIKPVVKAIEHQSIQQAKKVTEDALVGINIRNRSQFHGVHELYQLCKVIGLI
ncbi:DNA-binding transcriptional MerR regulator [Virgibacillus natechei]|uniref:DNA-binding transcriptional MerR regulator n=1 Tax=Virgibacillus natechei TaxID=1216297 RepID=A0ABS4IBP5_9BACI|nr:MerR family transcriptional regulator [Virgibacillus natechei]MBP1968352.1 DNA-binding transcriptional MerR regulator [Virgibacillus natechei]UZD13483.1 MerR family transcriptional regulator [Virgibacillus natechei]